MEKVKAEFYFQCAYRNQRDVDENATVILIIDYKSKNYSIKPYCGTEGFQFIQCSHKWKLWKAICTAISEAIDFGNKELNINN